MKIFNSILLFFVGFQLNAQTADDVFKKGEVQRKNGKHKEAIEFYTQALSIDQDHGNARYQRGFCYALLKEYQSAIADYSYVLEKRPNFVWAYISRGSSLNKLNRFQEALSDFNKALEIEPDNQEAFNNRGWAKKGLNDDKGACEDWRKSKKLGNEEAKIILGNSGCK